MIRDAADEVKQAGRTGSGKSAFWNWLADLDQESTKLPQAASLSEGLFKYGFFMLVRYPRLQPPVPFRNEAKVDFESDHHIFHRRLAESEARVTLIEDLGSVLQKVNPDLRTQLAALEIDCETDCETDFEYYIPHSQNLKEMTRLAQGTERSQKKIQKYPSRVLLDCSAVALSTAFAVK